MPPRGLKGKGAGRSALGAAVAIASKVAALAAFEPFATWNTPLFWWGVLYFLDGLIEFYSDRSLIVNHGDEFWFLCLPLSLGLWTALDLLHRRVGAAIMPPLPEDTFRFAAAYATSFATVTPALLLTAAALEAWEVFRDRRCRPRAPSASALALLLGLGLACLALPLLWPHPAARPAIWLFPVLLAEPLAYRTGAPSLLRDVEIGYLGRIFRLAVAGLLCGFFWEYGNFWARAPWVVSAPVVAWVRPTSTPLLGLVGWIPYAWGVFALQALVSRFLVSGRPWLRRAKP